MPPTITRKTWAGATGTYSTQPDTGTLGELLTPRRLPGKPRPRVDRRAYPKADDGRSTRDYVAAYWRLNTMRDGIRITGPRVHAYADHLDHLALYEPLSTARQFAPVDSMAEEVTP
jgi:hypothetical protein